MAETYPAYLVWIETTTGPQPQIWFEDKGRCVGPSDIVVIARHLLPDYADPKRLKLETIAALYPLTHEAA